jgi:hypothetical protein
LEKKKSITRRLQPYVNLDRSQRTRTDHSLGKGQDRNWCEGCITSMNILWPYLTVRESQNCE